MKAIYFRMFSLTDNIEKNFLKYNNSLAKDENNNNNIIL